MGSGRAVLREREETVTDRHDDDDAGDYLFSSIGVGHNERTRRHHCIRRALCNICEYTVRSIICELVTCVRSSAAHITRTSCDGWVPAASEGTA